jgi:hypothetical protein
MGFQCIDSLAETMDENRVIHQWILWYPGQVPSKYWCSLWKLCGRTENNNLVLQLHSVFSFQTLSFGCLVRSFRHLNSVFSCEYMKILCLFLVDIENLGDYPLVVGSCDGYGSSAPTRVTLFSGCKEPGLCK